MGLLVTMVTADPTACVGVGAGSRAGALWKGQRLRKLAPAIGTSGGTGGRGLPAAKCGPPEVVSGKLAGNCGGLIIRFLWFNLRPFIPIFKMRKAAYRYRYIAIPYSRSHSAGLRFYFDFFFF